MSLCAWRFDSSGQCRVLEANERATFCTLRTRIKCELYRGQTKTFEKHVFNECCIDRGISDSMLHMECFIDGGYVTTVLVCSRPLCSSIFAFYPFMQAYMMGPRGRIYWQNLIPCQSIPGLSLGQHWFLAGELSVYTRQAHTSCTLPPRSALVSRALKGLCTQCGIA